MAQTKVNEITVNNIRIGGKAPKKIMKGSTEVKEVKKRSTVVYKKEDVTVDLIVDFNWSWGNYWSNNT